MPFSTYLRGSETRSPSSQAQVQDTGGTDRVDEHAYEDRDHQRYHPSHEQQQRGHQLHPGGYSTYSDIDAMRQYRDGSYSTAMLTTTLNYSSSRPAGAPSPSPPFNAHGSNAHTHTHTQNPSLSSPGAGVSSSVKSYIPHSPSPLTSMQQHRQQQQQQHGQLQRTGSDGLFQMPSFLMGNFGGTLAPGGGAEVLTPGTLGMFDFVSTTPFGPASSISPHDSECGKPPLWQSAKYYTFDGRLQQQRQQQYEDDIAETSPTTVSATAAAAAVVTAIAGQTGHGHTPTSDPGSSSTTGPAAASSPFGYLNAESPRQPHHNAPAGAQEVPQLQSTATNANTSIGAAISPIEQCSSPAAMMMDASHDSLFSLPPVVPSSVVPPGAIDLYAPVPTAGLPVYSQSGFDMLSILARVARRPNPTISLGPVDLTCAFVVADVRRADAPIIYASRTFCELTGYTESEVVGWNCRFLQAPGGRVSRSDVRRFTSPEAVRELRFALDKDREVQVSLINYRKDGRPFVNRVSVVPVPAEDGASEIAFHVGFQVDLNQQPELIAQRMQDGKFYSVGGDNLLLKTQTPAERSARGMGNKLRALLSDEEFQSSVKLTTTCNSIPTSAAATSMTHTIINPNNTNSTPTSDSPAQPSSNTTKSTISTGKPDARDGRQWLNLLLLEHMPDFVHVLSLKGHFLYVSPGITRVLGYAPSDLVGKSVGDFCHPSDAVPLLRELKESTGQATTAVGGNANEAIGSGGSVAGQGEAQEMQASSHTQTLAQNGGGQQQQQQQQQRMVDLLFRMRTKSGGYAWIESTGRLHIEAGKGRKAIVLSGRMCAMPSLRWGIISQAGGLIPPASSMSSSPLPDVQASGESERNEGEHGQARASVTEREFWAMLCEDGLFLVTSTGVRDLLGWGTAEMIGRSVREFVIDDTNPSASASGDSSYNSASSSPDQILSALGRAYAGEQGTQVLSCRMKKRDGEAVWMQLMLYANESRTVSGRVIVQFKLHSSLNAASSSPPTSGYQPYSPTNYVSPGYAFTFTAPLAPPAHMHTQQPSYPYPYPYDLPDVGSASGMGLGTGTGGGRILRAHNTNVFAEFETHRGTSWQYELQQLKYENDKLREDVGVLEARQRLMRLHRERDRSRHQQQSSWVGNR